MQQSPLFTSPAASQALPFVDYDYPADRQRWSGLVLVGEAPGADEARQGHPFVGRSGQLLNELLLKVGISRADALVANAFRLQPPGNKIDHFFTSRRKATAEAIQIAEQWGQFGSNWCRADYAVDLDHLQRTLIDWQPKIIMALGRTPFWALTGENGLLTKVGQALPNRMLPNVKVIPTFHPSFILRGNWALQPDWERHFQTAKQYLAATVARK
jgi:DNA polymerase